MTKPGAWRNRALACLLDPPIPFCYFTAAFSSDDLACLRAQEFHGEAAPPTT